MAEYSAARGLFPLSELEFACTAALAEPLLAPGESLRDAMSGAAHLARRRCCWLHKPAEVSDLAFALAMFDWWPIKPDPPAQVRAALLSLRKAAFKGASRFVYEKGNMHALYWLVPVRTLMLDWPDLFDRQAAGVLSYLHVPLRRDLDLSSEPDVLPDSPPAVRLVLGPA